MVVLFTLWVSFCQAQVPGFDDPVIYPPEVYPGEAVPGGELLVDGDDPSGVANTLVLEHTSVVAEVNAGLARVTMVQWFQNPYDESISATYRLPLPEKAAVDRMELVCGDRHVEGIVLEREAARELYDDAKADGRKAALLEQERDNLFTQSVSNLCPGETVELTLQWVEPLTYEDGTYTWAMPLTVGPRYSPPWVEDADRLTTPYDRDGQTVDLTVAIEEGIPVSSLWSDTHDIAVEDEGAWGAEVALEAEETIPNRDFELSWSLAGKRPAAGIVTARPRADEPGWLSLTIEPPELGPQFVNRPRELVFVVDQSCSMDGEPYDAAKAAVARSLKGMRPTDTFNLVRFSDSADTLFATSQASTSANREAAASWLEGFTGGSTRMEKGLVEALDHEKTPGALRLVVLLTDAFVGQDDAVLRLVKEHLGTSRIFGFGVSASPNRALFAKLAEVGRGAVIYHHPGRDIDEAVRTFEAQISHPAMTDVHVSWGGLHVTETYPSVLPDLWAGQPLRLYARYDGSATTATVRVTGTVGSRPYTMDLPVEAAQPDARHEAVITAWARAKIADLGRHRSGAALREAVVDVALDYGLVTRWTSLVAVDDEVAACGPAGVTVRVPNQAPVDMTQIGGLVGMVGTSGSYSQASGYGTGSSSGYGRGGGMVGMRFSSKREGGVSSMSGDTIILGSLDRSLIDSVVKSRISEVKHCYAQELQKHPTLAGKLGSRFVIAGDGSVSSSTIKSSTLGNPAVETCVSGAILRWAFPAVPGGGVQIVNYPFVFAPEVTDPAK